MLFALIYLICLAEISPPIQTKRAETTKDNTPHTDFTQLQPNDSLKQVHNKVNKEDFPT